MTTLAVSVIVLIALQAADAYTTLHILAAGGHENNPFLRYLFERFNPATTLIVAKTIAIVIFLGVVYLNYLPDYAVWVANAVYALVVLNNLRHMR